MRSIKRQSHWPWRRGAKKGTNQRRGCAKLSQQRQRRTMGIAILSGVAVLIVGIGWIWRSGAIDAVTAAVSRSADRIVVGAGMTVESVRVFGVEQAERETVMAAINARIGQSIFSQDIDAAQARLADLGWVEDAKVSRLLPDTLVVQVDEREPYAVWQRQGSFALIDRDGEVITTENLTRFADLPLLVGDGARRRAEIIITSLSKEPELFRRVQAVVRVSDRRWNIYFDNGVQARLPAGAPQEAWVRLARMEEEHRLLSRDVDAIDMRLPDRMVLRLGRRAAHERRDPGKET